MGLANKLKDLAVKLEISNDSVFGYPIEKQKQYIAHFPEPKDDIQRSFFQYKCQMKFNKPIITFALNIASFPLLLLYLFKSGSLVHQGEEQKSSVFFSDGKPENIISEELKERVGEIEVINNKKEALTKADKKFICSVWRRYPFSFQFVVKCLLKVRYYSYEIQRVHPQNIIVCNEYSFTSSVLTKYCEKHGIKHINVMHGEKIYYMRDSFFRFHECYIWDNYYKELFIEMKADPKQFEVSIPDSMRFKKDNSIKKIIDYTYYLGWESGKQLNQIIEEMIQLQRLGVVVAIRPHPRYTKMSEIDRYASTIQIENCQKISIEKSLMRTENAISLYSTVLNQAYCNDIGVVIDDVTNIEKYKKLKERRYIMLNKPHRLLSEILKK